MNEQEKLSGIRDRIDAIDKQIQSLINQRAECAQEVAEIKINAGEIFCALAARHALASFFLLIAGNN